MQTQSTLIDFHLPADAPMDTDCMVWELIPGLGWVADRSQALHYLLQPMTWAGEPDKTYIDVFQAQSKRRVAVTLRKEMPPADADCGRLF